MTPAATPRDTAVCSPKKGKLSATAERVRRPSGWEDDWIGRLEPGKMRGQPSRSLPNPPAKEFPLN